MKKIIGMFCLTLLLAGCQADNQIEGEAIDIEILISTNNQEEILNQDQLEVEDSAILLDVLKEHYEVEASSEGFITAIEGVEQYDDFYWFYEVNQEEVFVGAGEYELSDGDEVNFDLHEWEE
ncbi:DUF4430 domain-containing protein [Amphibacillus jilinensis]|uniref:DUF4430 domain-containing protein n=1 Tax=Amphibacillus jilinensis TaxID=1216008 RepID=UPI0002EAA177|nr:DUF4430 domain-containing protein [Amphibacillus jilinensis]